MFLICLPELFFYSFIWELDLIKFKLNLFIISLLKIILDDLGSNIFQTGRLKSWLKKNKKKKILEPIYSRISKETE